jgi:RNA polymerase sigma-B factor
MDVIWMINEQKTVKNPDLELAVLTYQGCPSEENLENVFSHATRLVHYFVHQYAFGHDCDDLIQAGYEGLLKALERFDPNRGVLFSTYAAHCILGGIRHEIRKEKVFYRPPWMIDLQHRVLKITDDMIRKSGEAPTLAEVAKAANIKEEGLAFVMQAGRIPLDNLDQALVRNQRYVSFQLPIEDKITLHQAMARLNRLQQRVLYLIFYQDYTQQQVADDLGISQRQVSRVLGKSLRILGEQCS